MHLLRNFVIFNGFEVSASEGERIVLRFLLFLALGVTTDSNELLGASLSIK